MTRSIILAPPTNNFRFRDNNLSYFKLFSLFPYFYFEISQSSSSSTARSFLMFDATTSTNNTSSTRNQYSHSFLDYQNTPLSPVKIKEEQIMIYDEESFIILLMISSSRLFVWFKIYCFTEVSKSRPPVCM